MEKLEHLINLFLNSNRLKSILETSSTLSKVKETSKWKQFCGNIDNDPTINKDLFDYLSYLKTAFPTLANESYYDDSEYKEICDLFQTKNDNVFPNAIHELCLLKVLMILYISHGFFEIDVSDFEQLNSKTNELSKSYSNDTTHVYYRGQQDSTFSLLPSIYRGLNETHKFVDFQYITNLYKENNLWDKYERCMQDPSKDIFTFYSYMQHACSYSPLLDFTNDKNVAFAFGNHCSQNFNLYENTNSSIFMLFLKDSSISSQEKITDALKENEIEYYKGKIKITDSIFGKKLFKTKLEDFIPKFFYCKGEANDRMKYQKGGFMFFYKAVFINGIVIFPYSESHIIKINIPGCMKGEVYESTIKQDNKYKYENLMDPYLFFSNYHDN